MSDEKPASAAASSETAPSAPRKMNGKTKLLLIVSCLLLMGFLRTGFIFFIVGMMPSVIAYITDQSKHRYMFQCVFACNLSGMMGFVLTLIVHGPSNVMLQQMMGSFINWITIYGAALMGWLVVKICPIVAEAMVHNMHKGQITRIQRVQKKLENEWGDEVTKISRQNTPDYDANPQ
jgi:hypothetical protein